MKEVYIVDTNARRGGVAKAKAKVAGAPMEITLQMISASAEVLRNSLTEYGTDFWPDAYSMAEEVLKKALASA